MREELSFLLTIFVIFLIGFGLGLTFEKPKVFFEEIGNNEALKIEDSREVATKLVAVDGRGNGILTDLSVKAVPGNGKLLVDVDNLLFWLDTQQSIQKAKKVAENYFKREIDDVDLTYTIKVEEGAVVGGPSAGAAFAVATIAALQNRTLRKDAIITGTIDENGKIGEVGGILAKVRAAKEGGFKYFLVPKGEKTVIEYKREEECETFGLTKICEINYRPVEIDVGKEFGINVIEVENVEEALKYMLW